MRITRDNIELIAAKFYTNEHCLTKEEFLEDLKIQKYVKKLARKISKGSSRNLRLLVNHVICFTNNFDLQFSKTYLLHDATDMEKRVIKSVFLYLGFIDKSEYVIEDLDLETIKMLKEMDN